MYATIPKKQDRDYYWGVKVVCLAETSKATTTITPHTQAHRAGRLLLELSAHGSGRSRIIERGFQESRKRQCENSFWETTPTHCQTKSISIILHMHCVHRVQLLIIYDQRHQDKARWDRWVFEDERTHFQVKNTKATQLNYAGRVGCIRGSQNAPASKVEMLQAWTLQQAR